MGSTLKNLTKKLEAAQAEMAREGKAALKLAFKEAFDECPSLKAVRWVQYTPFFNDGDECVFRVCDFTVNFKDSPEDSGDREDGFDYVSSLDEYNADYMKTPDARAALKLLEEIEGAPKDIFRTTFGDHVQITATRRGFEVEEYEHE